MATRTFEIKATTLEAIESAVASGRFPSAEAYLAELVARDQRWSDGERRAGQYLADRVAAARASGPGMEMTPAQLGEALREVHQRVTTARGEGAGL